MMIDDKNPSILQSSLQVYLHRQSQFGFFSEERVPFEDKVYIGEVKLFDARVKLVERLYLEDVFGGSLASYFLDGSSSLYCHF